MKLRWMSTGLLLAYVMNGAGNVFAQGPIILAPYFSSELRDRGGKVSYYILGQSPMGGGTTLRCVTAEGANCNLGPGPDPTIDLFHAELSLKVSPE